jgi:hypothetical protein
MRRGDKGRLPPFVPLLKDTVKTAAWKALSHGARSVYVALRSRYNLTTQNAVYVSTRKKATKPHRACLAPSKTQ